MDPPAPPSEPPAPEGAVDRDAYCVGCSYNLRGLDAAGRCPECGMPVERSLRGDLLEYSAPAYLQSLRRGILIVIVTMIAEIVAGVLGIALMIIVAVMPSISPELADSLFEINGQFAVSMLNGAIAIAAAYGWWLFSMPDPAIVTENTGATARKYVRFAAVASACATAGAILPHGMAFAGRIALEVTAGASGVIALIAGVALYFASLLYVRWLARRVPDQKMYADATRLLWLGPLIYVVGSCLIVGPFVAMVLYLLLLNRMRMAFCKIMEARPPAAATG